MSDNIYKDAWDKLYQDKYLKQLEDLNATKRKLNMLAEEAGMSQLFEIDGEEKKAGAATFKIEPGDFLGKKLATSVTTILTDYGKPLTLDQIIEYLKQGSFHVGNMGGENKVKESIQKNTTTFSLLPHSGGLYGLKSWYDSPGKKGKKKSGEGEAESSEQAESESEIPEAETNGESQNEEG